MTNATPPRDWWRIVQVVLVKELTDHLRDRRSLCLSMIYPLLGPLLLGGTLFFAGNALEGAKTIETTTIPTIGIGSAPELETYLASQNIRLVPAPIDAEQAVRDGLIPVVLVLPKDAVAGRFGVRVLQDLTRVANVKPTSRLVASIHGFNRYKADQATQAAGLPDGFSSHVSITRENMARDTNIALFFYNFIPPLLIFMIFLGAVYLSIDVTAGERERGSLEPLLIAPLQRWELLLAKTLAAFMFTAGIVAIHLLAFWAVLTLATAPSERLAPPPDLAVFIILFVLALPIMAVAVSFQMSIAVLTRSMKEAQIYLGLLPLVPALPGMIMVIAPVTPSLWTAMVPVFGQLVIFSQLVAGDTPDITQTILSVCSTGSLAIILFRQAAKLFSREKMFFLG